MFRRHLNSRCSSGYEAAPRLLPGRRLVLLLCRMYAAEKESEKK